MADTTLDKLSDRELKTSYWYITHKLQLRRWLVIILICISAGLWFYIGWQLVFYAIDFTAENNMIFKVAGGRNQLIGILDSRRPQQLDFASVQSVNVDESRNDFFGEVFNPNPNWLAIFDYTFQSNNKDVPTKQDFVLPGEKKYIMGLGIKGNDAQASISGIRWRKIANYDSLKNDRSNMVIENEEFKAGQKAGDPNSVEFDITNKSAYGYFAVGVQAFLSGGGPIGVNYITIERLTAGEQRHVTINWNNRLPRVDNIEIIPDFNFLDASNIMPPKGE